METRYKKRKLSENNSNSGKNPKNPKNNGNNGESDDESDDYDDYEEDEYYYDEEEDEDMGMLTDKDVQVLKKLKRYNHSIYKKYVTCKEIIKNREITLEDILKVEISDEKRANLIEQLEILRQIEKGTDEYLTQRDKMRNLYIKYIADSYLPPQLSLSPHLSGVKNVSIKFGKTDTQTDIENFKRKIRELVCSDQNRKVLEEKLDEYEECEKGDEKSKMKRWLNNALSLPFDKLSGAEESKEMSICDRVKNTQEFLNKKLYGMKNVKERLILFLNKKLREGASRGCNIALVGKPGVGKCLAPNTPVMMYDLTIKAAKDIEKDDLLLGDDGTPRHVLSVTSGTEEMYTVFQKYSESYTVNKSHILTVYDEVEKKIIDIPISKVIEDPNYSKRYFPVSSLYSGKEKVVEPYTIGKNVSSPISKITSLPSIPNNYRGWDINDKIEFYAGLLDGTEICTNENDNNEIHIYIPKDRPIYKIMDLLRSAGMRCVYENNFLKIGSTRLLNKLKSYQAYQCLEDELHIYSVGEGNYNGFTLDGNERFVLGDWTVTHNTAIARSLSECLKIPFAQLSFGGVTNTEFLMGHDYTYVGSRPGEISRCITRMGSKNGILFFDEFDKASDKKDIMSTLLHVTDFSQNSEFRDNYFPELTQDLSKVWFIYSMNELPKDPAMLDRLEIISVDEYTTEERISISRDYLFPKYTKEVSIKDDIIVTEEGLKKIVELSSGGLDRKGVRDLERYINLIVEKIYFYICNPDLDYRYNWYKKIHSSKDKDKDNKIVLTSSLVETILEENKKVMDSRFVYTSMYI